MTRVFVGHDSRIRSRVRRIVPLPVRRPLGIAAYRVLRPIREAPARLPEILGRVPILAVRDLVYDDGFYDRADPEAEALYARTVDAVVRLRSPRSVVDVGCGTGFMLARFAEHGLDVRGG